ncbi:mucoidy inhibitor MuiA family protein [Nocardia miyunensis]|uniref:mucoidy inhibitor MuiA family protein n=1 Tax=Nocardia miyunensis TaxID=282684 RepID=UPI00082F5AEC|nr:mucoidy inhibitor MuiA family protein [Nocardia miyunensis]
MSMVDAPIVAVTVYPGQARITRRTTVIVEAGEQAVEVGGLPLGLVRDSVRVSGRGAAAVLGVDVSMRHHPRSPDAVVQELEQRAEQIRSELAELADSRTVEDSRTELLTSLGRRSGSAFAKALAAGEIEPDRVAGLSDSLAQQLAATLARQRELHRRNERREEDLRAVERDLAEHHRQRTPDRQQIAVSLDVHEAGELELELSYVVDDARWISTYDIRLHGERLTLGWYAEITQNTGEDWPPCELTLSTARPAISARLPEPEPWFLDRLRPPEPIAYGAPAGGPPEPGTMPRAKVLHTAMVESPTPAIEHGAAATTYRPSQRIAVPSDATAHRTTVATLDLEATLDHITAPAQSQEVYLRATAVNTSEHTLRPGRASVFHDSEFVGTTTLEVWAPGEEIELNLGVDERIRAERELVRRTAGKVVIGSSTRREVRYRITVGNYGRRATTVTVLDRVPVSRDEAIVVRDITCRPDPHQRTDLGELTWRLSLEPEATADISLGFRVDTAKGVELQGWRE